MQWRRSRDTLGEAPCGPGASSKERAPADVSGGVHRRPGGARWVGACTDHHGHRRASAARSRPVPLGSLWTPRRWGPSAGRAQLSWAPPWRRHPIRRLTLRAKEGSPVLFTPHRRGRSCQEPRPETARLWFPLHIPSRLARHRRDAARSVAPHGSRHVGRRDNLNGANLVPRLWQQQGNSDTAQGERPAMATPFNSRASRAHVSASVGTRSPPRERAGPSSPVYPSRCPPPRTRC